MGTRGPEGIPRELVARVKGALELGIPAKVVSKLTGLSLETVRDIQKGKRRAAIPADPALLEAVRKAILSA